MSKKNLFIIIYGIDGVGKTTIVNELDKKLKKLKYDSFNFDNFKKNKLSNPYYSSKKNIVSDCSDSSQFFHYLGSNIFKADIIKDLLKEGKTVVKSRWFLDIFADFSYRGLDFIEDIKEKVPFLIPDISILLTVDENERLSRVQKRNKANTLNDLNTKRIYFFKKYLEKSFKNKFYNNKNFLKIDTTNKSPSEITDIIISFCIKNK